MTRKTRSQESKEKENEKPNNKKMADYIGWIAQYKQAASQNVGL